MRTGLTVQTFYGHLNTINDAVFSIGGQYVSTCDSDGIVKLWDIRMVQELFSVDTGNAIAHCMAFDKSMKCLAVGCSDSDIKFCSYAFRKLFCKAMFFYHSITPFTR